MYKPNSKLSVNNARKVNSKKKPDGYVYVIKQNNSDIYKIGVSANPKRRIKDIDSVNPYGVEIVFAKFFKNAYEMEECIHDCFGLNLLRKEWFKIVKEDVTQLILDLTTLAKGNYYLTRI